MHRDRFTRLRRDGPPSDHKSESELMIFSSPQGRTGQTDHEDRVRYFLGSKDETPGDGIHWGWNYDDEDYPDPKGLWLNTNTFWVNRLTSEATGWAYFNMGDGGFFEVDTDASRFNLNHAIEFYVGSFYADSSRSGFGDCFLALDDHGRVQIGADDGTDIEFTADLGAGIHLRSRYSAVFTSFFRATDSDWDVNIYDASASQVFNMNVFADPIGSSTLYNNSSIGMSGENSYMASQKGTGTTYKSSGIFFDADNPSMSIVVNRHASASGSASIYMNAQGSDGLITIDSDGNLQLIAGGYIQLQTLPTSAPSGPSGQLWNNGGVVNIT